MADTNLPQSKRRVAPELRNFSTAKLFVVGTPIGDLEDLSDKQRRILGDVDIVFAEDTRRTRILLQAIGGNAAHKNVVSLHRHNEASRREGLLEHWQQGAWVALVSDAGMPGISDPGAQTVAFAHQHGVAVEVVPGPSALACALAASGESIEEGGARFVGFLPAKGGARSRAVQALAMDHAVIVLFEAPHRLHDLLKRLGQIMPERRICVCRELTKVYEEVRVDKARILAEDLPPARGELTLVLGRRSKGLRAGSDGRDQDGDGDESQETSQETSPEQASITAEQAALKLMQSQSRTKDVARIIATLFEMSGAQAYEMVQRVKGG